MEMEDLMILKIILFALLFLIVLFCYSACVVSGRCSREEEQNNEKI
jgi:heme/copper-type cytochrome/quinol oxidase subunit 2